MWVKLEGETQLQCIHESRWTHQWSKMVAVSRPSPLSLHSRTNFFGWRQKTSLDPEPAVSLHPRRCPARGPQLRQRLLALRQPQEEDQLLQGARGAPASHLRDGPLPRHQPPREPVSGHRPARVTDPGVSSIQTRSKELTKVVRSHIYSEILKEAAGRRLKAAEIGNHPKPVQDSYTR